MFVVFGSPASCEVALAGTEMRSTNADARGGRQTNFQFARIPYVISNAWLSDLCCVVQVSCNILLVEGN